MLELAAALRALQSEGRSVAVATVVGTDGSTPRDLGTSMAVDDLGRVHGSISGGCVEGAVYEVAQRVLSSGRAEQAEFGYSDEDAFAVGLSCGGRIAVVVYPLPSPEQTPWLVSALDAAAAGAAAAVEIALDDEVLGRLVPVPDAAHAPGSGTRRLRSRCEGVATEALRLVSDAPPRLIIFGAVDFSAALADAGRLLGYRVTVCDARPVFATAERFPSAEVVTDWPDRYLAGTEVDARTVIAVLTHDPKFDIPVLRIALTLPVAYVGAMGSRRSHERRRELLQEAGVSEEELARLHSPIGLDLGAASPQETAVSILAEVIRERTGATGLPLRERSGPIHAERAAAASPAPL